MRVFVTGAAGQLGAVVVAQLRRRGHEVIGSDVAELDITDRSAVEAALAAQKPDAVIHCAAWTAVDAAEDAPETVAAVNALGTRYLAQSCQKLDCKLMYISTDYVFSGRGETPWDPDCREFEPLNVYGRTKLEGEEAVRQLVDKYFIVRIAWVFGPGGKNFVNTMLTLGKKYPTLRVVRDQIGTPTYTVDLARLLADMIETDRYGCYHATNEGGFISWCDFAREIFRQAGYDIRVEGVTTEEYGASKASRPFNSRLDKSKLIARGFTPLPPWQDALARYLKEIGE